MAKTPKVTEDIAAVEVTSEVTSEVTPEVIVEEPVVLMASTLAEIEAGKAALAKYAELIQAQTE